MVVISTHWGFRISEKFLICTTMWKVSNKSVIGISKSLTIYFTRAPREESIHLKYTLLGCSFKKITKNAVCVIFLQPTSVLQLSDSNRLFYSVVCIHSGQKRSRSERDWHLGRAWLALDARGSGRSWVASRRVDCRAVVSRTVVSRSGAGPFSTTTDRRTARSITTRSAAVCAPPVRSRFPAAAWPPWARSSIRNTSSAVSVCTSSTRAPSRNTRTSPTATSASANYSTESDPSRAERAELNWTALYLSDSRTLS